MNYPDIPSTAPNLYMVGFMGTGKSVIGNRVAQQLNMPYVDSDHHIESSEGMSIPQIFEQSGESHFRELERKFIEIERPAGGTVISCGGGLVTNDSLLQQIKNTGVVVVLYASVDTIFNRIANDPNRPLMKTENPRERIETLLSQREPIYRKAGIGIMTDGYTMNEIVEKVIRIYLEHL